MVQNEMIIRIQGSTFLNMQHVRKIQASINNLDVNSAEHYKVRVFNTVTDTPETYYLSKWDYEVFEGKLKTLEDVALQATS
jgi:hypothetical protein